MANVTADVLKVDRPLGGVPFGNLSVLPFSQAFASGVAADTDKATAVAIDDVMILGTLPKGLTIKDAVIKATAAIGAASSTLTVGFKYVDGVDSTAVPQDADYFCAAIANTAAYIARASNTAVSPVTLPKDAYLTATVNTAALSGNGTLFIDVYGICDQD